MILNIEHTTKYSYENEVKHSIQYLRLTPRLASNQRVLKWEIETPATPQIITDGFGNIVHVLTMDKPHRTLELVARGTVEISGHEALGDDGLNPILFLRQTPLTKLGPKLQKICAQYSQDMRNIDASLQDMSAHILHLVPYDKNKTNSQTTAEQAIEAGGGVCQDHTHIFVGLCRARGIPARYVSGYLQIRDCNHVSTHAWAEAYYNNSWHTFDISNQLTSPSSHIKVAIGLDYLEASPVRGMRQGGGTEKMDTEVVVDIFNSSILSNNIVPTQSDFSYVQQSQSAEHPEIQQQQQQQINCLEKWIVDKQNGKVYLKN